MQRRRCAITDIVNLYDAKTNLSKLVNGAVAGEEIVIAKPGKPNAKLVPSRHEKSADSDRISSGSPTSVGISMGLCRPSCRSTLSRSVGLLIDTHILLWANDRPCLGSAR
jgi:prevent-host-death family protein